MRLKSTKTCMIWPLPASSASSLFILYSPPTLVSVQFLNAPSSFSILGCHCWLFCPEVSLPNYSYGGFFFYSLELLNITPIQGRYSALLQSILFLFLHSTYNWSLYICLLIQLISISTTRSKTSGGQWPQWSCLSQWDLLPSMVFDTVISAQWISDERINLFHK